MNIEDYYKQAKAWQDQAAEAERYAAAQVEKETEAEWKSIAAMIRETLPIEGMIIYETRMGQFNELPSQFLGHSVDCQIDPANQENMKLPVNDPRRNMDGVIRVSIFIDNDNQKTEWEVYNYTVWVNGVPTCFDNPHAAFLAAYKPAKVEA
jgi:hypothetical protein